MLDGVIGAATTEFVEDVRLDGAEHGVLFSEGFLKGFVVLNHPEETRRDLKILKNY